MSDLSSKRIGFPTQGKVSEVTLCQMVEKVGGAANVERIELSGEHSRTVHRMIGSELDGPVIRVEGFDIPVAANRPKTWIYLKDRSKIRAAE